MGRPMGRPMGTLFSRKPCDFTLFSRTPGNKKKPPYQACCSTWQQFELTSAEQRLAPGYLTHLYQQQKRLASYFVQFLTAKNLQDTPLFREVRRLAQTVDDLIYFDQFDVVNSVAVERIVRRLYGVEVALENINSKDQLSKADWTVADLYDLSHLEGNTYKSEKVQDEVKKHLERKAALQKYVYKVKEDKPK